MSLRSYLLNKNKIVSLEICSLSVEFPRFPIKYFICLKLIVNFAIIHIHVIITFLTPPCALFCEQFERNLANLTI